jgi:cell division septal protein FtsQ
MSASTRSWRMNHIIAANIADLIMLLSMFILCILYVYILIVMFTDYFHSRASAVTGN